MAKNSSNKTSKPQQKSNLEVILQKIKEFELALHLNSELTKKELIYLKKALLETVELLAGT